MVVFGQSNFVLKVWSAIFAFLLLCLMPQTAVAQVATSYNDTPAAAINIPDNGCAATGTSVVRTFNVPTSYLISDVNIGILITHEFRSDLRITLSHNTTTITLTSGAGAGANNLNATFDDEATGGTIGAHNTDDPLTPVYFSTKIPLQALSNFDGQNATGLWTLTMCDLAGADLGTYVRSTLTVTSPPAAYADLSLTNTISNATPAVGGTTDYTLTVTNAATSPTAAAGVTVADILPAGTTFNSVVSGTGTYNNGTGIWTVGAVPIGASRSIVIRVNVTASAGTTITNIAQISASSIVDLDSTPNNNVVTEDDYAARSFTVAGTRVAGTPPALVCPAGSTLFDWDTVAWTIGGTTGTFPLTGFGDIKYTLSNPGAWLNLAAYGGQAPVRQATITGGFAGQNSLFMGVDLANTSQSATAVIKLDTAIPAAQFRIFDVDFNAGQYADRVTVTGTFNGVAVAPPILTSGESNFVIGNSAYGDGNSLDTEAKGNIVVTFQNPVDTITINYGNHSTAPANPGQQAITLHDLTFCNPQATLNITKISNVISDGVSASNFKSIPGAVVRYCIQISNAGSGTATNVVASDPLPSGVTYIPGTMRTGPACASATTVEDEDAAGPDEADAFGMSITGTTITGTGASIAPAANMALVFNATVD
jgi:uncharacterized repeat protein (TIGR01451 family)